MRPTVMLHCLRRLIRYSVRRRARKYGSLKRSSLFNKEKERNASIGVLPNATDYKKRDPKNLKLGYVMKVKGRAIILKKR